MSNPNPHPNANPHSHRDPHAKPTLTLTRYAAAIEYAIGQQPGGRAWADGMGMAPQVGVRGRGEGGVRGRSQP